MYDISVFIGRFQLPHLGHLKVIRTALEKSDWLIVLIGSSFRPRSYRNPFTVDEREKMLANSLTPEERKRVTFLPLEDTPYNDVKWVSDVQTKVNNQIAIAQHCSPTFPKEPRVALIGHSKDASSYYLKMFPQWDSIAVDNFEGLDSTRFRKLLFSNVSDMWLSDCDGHNVGDSVKDAYISSATRDFLLDFVKTKDYRYVLEEYNHVNEYRAQWANSPYPPTFVTVDAVVHQSGHILVVERGASPGKGLLALPGGFLNPGEKIVDGMLRELREETCLKVPKPVLRGSIKAVQVFDDPNRSSRGRTITHAHLIDLGHDSKLPKVKGADDAAKAFFIPISNVRSEDFFEDHRDIISTMIDKL